MKKIKIGTHGHRLALWRAEFGKNELAKLGLEASLHLLETKGGKFDDNVFSTKKTEDALLRGEADVAVHDLKHLPTSQPGGLVLAAVSERGTPADWLLIRPESTVGEGLFGLRPNAIVGTGSLRQAAQILELCPGLNIKNTGAGVPARIENLRSGNLDAILLAGADASRLELNVEDLKTVRFHPKELVPAPAQGALVFQCREDDLPTRRLLKKLHHAKTAAATNVERGVLRLIGDGHHASLGVFCEMDERGNYHVSAAYATAWDAPVKRAGISSGTHLNLAERIVEKLIPQR